MTQETAPDAAHRPLPALAADTTADSPWPLRLLSAKIRDYVARMSPVWVEGQVAQLTRRPGDFRAYLSLRDADEDVSTTVTIPVRVLDSSAVPVQQGSKVVVHAKASYWMKRGTFQLEGKDIQPVGEGLLMQQLEQLKRRLSEEGLFDADAKRPLPFLPTTVGVICGRASAAEKDVVENARRRWPAVRFELRTVPVQGHDAARAVTAALHELDALPHVDVIIITRGGGSFEDLLPFSDETLVRAVSAATTPIVSAIGHEIDTPLLDFVADLRASTPTDAAKRVVPDVKEEHAGIVATTSRIRELIMARLHTERQHLSNLRTRPALADPAAFLTPHRTGLAETRHRLRHCITQQLSRGRDHLAHLSAQGRALSPHATVARGYAIVTAANGSLVTTVTAVAPGEHLRTQLAHGSFTSSVTTIDPHTNEGISA